MFARFKTKIYPKFFRFLARTAEKQVIQRPRLRLSIRVLNCVKSVRNRSYYVPHFLRVWTEYEEIWSISPYLAQMRENIRSYSSPVFLVFGLNTSLHLVRMREKADHNKSECGHF